MFFEQFKKLCDQRGTSPNGVAKVLHISSGSVTSWKKDGIIPSTKTLQKIADYFSVTTDYLLGKETSDKAGPLKSILAQLDDGSDNELVQTIKGLIAERDKNKKFVPELTVDEQKVLKYYERLTDEQKDYIKGEMARLNMANKQDAEFADEKAT